jgi:hypothetical protein
MTTYKFYSRSGIKIALSLACLLAALLILNIKTIHWPFGIIDSPIILAQAIAYSPIEYLTSPHKYQFLTYNNFTPWVTLSWDIDYSFFQVDPLGYRVHHLVSLAIMVALIYLILYRATGSILNTSIFCLAILTLPATFSVVDDIINRHYLEGMIFCLLSFFCAQTYSRGSSPAWLALSVLSYGLSMTAKEVFIPLPGIIFFLYPGSFKRRVLLSLPYAVVLFSYLAWRMYMLGGYGGYTGGITILNVLEQEGALTLITLQLLTTTFFSPVAASIMLALLGVLLATNFRQITPSVKLGLLVGVFGLALPLIALLPMFAIGFLMPRWLFAPTVALVMFISYLCSRTPSKTVTGLTYCVVFACSVGAFYARLQEPVPPYTMGGGKAYQYILESDPDHYLRMPRFSQMAGQGYSVWTYIAKLRNNAWGTLTVNDVGQLKYHNIEGKSDHRLGRKRGKLKPVDNTLAADLPLIEHANYNPDTGALSFQFSDQLTSESCFVYIFGEHNGFLFSTPDCLEWSVQYRELAYQVRMIGYELADASIAVWSAQPNDRLYSQPYKIHEPIDLDSIPALAR